MASAAAIAELGADVALVGRRGELAEKNAQFIARKFEVKAFPVVSDVSDQVSVKRMMDTVLQEFGRIDAVHSNAGIIMDDDNGDMPLSSWQKMFDVNLTGTFLVNKAAAVWMRDNGVRGSIVNTSSICGHVVNYMPGRQMVAYTTTKAGIIHLTKSMAMDFVDAGIRVNSVSPGYILSGIHDDMVSQDKLDEMIKDVPMKRFGTLDETGGIVAFLMTDLASYITGADILVDGGYVVR